VPQLFPAAPIATMARFARPTLAFDGDHGPVMITSMLEAEGVAVSFDDRPPRPHVGRKFPPRLYVAREDVAQARRSIESGRL
jgi:hypothetical protein